MTTGIPVNLCSRDPIVLCSTGLEGCGSDLLFILVSEILSTVPS